MAVGKRIRYFRQKNNLTQKQLGELLGYSKSTAEVRANQYENEIRLPKMNTLKKLGEIFDVDAAVFQIPDIESRVGLMQTFFALEDFAGWKLTKVDGKFAIVIGADSQGVQKMFDDSILQEWLDKEEALARGELTREEYDAWRYHYTEKNLEKHLLAVQQKLLAEQQGW